MSQILVISPLPENVAFFRSHFSAEDGFVSVGDENLARLLLHETGFDLIVAEGAGAAFLSEASKVSVVLSVGGEDFSDRGVFVLKKKEDFPAVLPWLRAARARIFSLQAENGILQKKIEDLSLVSRAKRVLQKTLGMTESEAHRYIEKQAMDLRVSKSAVARRILATYA